MNPISRREALSLLGHSLALLPFASCRRSTRSIVTQPPGARDRKPGEPEQYATAALLYGTAVGLLVTSHDGRPTKIEGNPRHPESLGATDARLQAMLYDLADPDRSRGPRKRGESVSRDAATEALRKMGQEAEKRRG